MSIRALVIDDSVVVRRVVAGVLDAEPDIEVVATAVNGKIGLEKIDQLSPDVVTLDIEMPVMDGLETLAAVRQRWPRLPVIMYSTLTQGGAEATLTALSQGAVDYATKPSNITSRDMVVDDVREQLIPKVRMWGRRMAPAPTANPTTMRTIVAPPRTSPGPRTGNPPANLVAIGVSTGGPDALARLIPRIGAHVSVPIIIVQHMPPVFTTLLAQRLNKIAELPVTETADGETVEPGHIYIAAGGVHTEIHRQTGQLKIAHTDAPKENSCRPSVDVMFRTAARATGGRTLGIVLTGMGQDGLAGSQAIRAAGGSVLAQDEATSVVWGMPGFVARAGLADAILPLDELTTPINALPSRARAGAPA